MLNKHFLTAYGGWFPNLSGVGLTILHSKNSTLLRTINILAGKDYFGRSFETRATWTIIDVTLKDKKQYSTATLKYLP
jgi:hypothetical protein